MPSLSLLQLTKDRAILLRYLPYCKSPEQDLPGRPLDVTEGTSKNHVAIPFDGKMEPVPVHAHRTAQNPNLPNSLHHGNRAGVRPWNHKVPPPSASRSAKRNTRRPSVEVPKLNL